MESFLICGKGNAAQFALKYAKELLVGRYRVLYLYRPNEVEVSKLTGLSNLDLANHLGIESIPVSNKSELESTVFEQNPSFIFLAQYSIIISEKILSRFEGRVINLHYGKLPEYRGVAPITHSILNKEQQGGVTLHFVDKGIDTGDVIRDTLFPISNKTNEEAYVSCEQAGRELILWLFGEIVNKKTLQRFEQNDAFAMYYSVADINYSDTTVNIEQCADDVIAYCNAFTFPSRNLFPYLVLNNNKYKILSQPVEVYAESEVDDGYVTFKVRDAILRVQVTLE